MAYCQKTTSAEAADHTPASPQQARSCQGSLRVFDTLPDSGHVRLPDVIALFACSRATVWRHVKSGVIPKPKKLGLRMSIWNVGELRECLRNLD